MCIKKSRKEKVGATKLEISTAAKRAKMQQEKTNELKIAGNRLSDNLEKCIIRACKAHNRFAGRFQCGCFSGRQLPVKQVFGINAGVLLFYDRSHIFKPTTRIVSGSNIAQY